MATLGLTKSPLLQPITVLAGWTFAMQAWMHVTRINAIGKYNVNIDASKINGELETKVPNSIQAIAHNYNHLHEQPTVFYAVALALIAAGDDHPYTVKAAWTYVGMRVVHSLYQTMVNKVLTRFQIFLGSSVVVGGLTARLATLVF
ncbi:Putative membrane-associated, eicosanoid/glutathione metabolism (MAPEG) protein [Septoria linicola]|uniref:Membrane-associated, eicosanoid/glutathione metabolism (MAPEG) protein n=1 Tax=Septoria linicola TaxID=215465 RepID=A0A9Q9AU10_9PEZI|nr:Putative membrane-associated, eicosanoid/glutathione metabolism (MAPEG) protein [Septoria linicola]